jgi:hypothetical protein
LPAELRFEKLHHARSMMEVDHVAHTPAASCAGAHQRPRSRAA